MIAEFGPDRAAGVCHHLLDRIPNGLANGARPRHLRCVPHLAEGDRAQLDRFIKACLRDTRDVMLWAEYEPGPRGESVRVRDFERPFDQSPP